MELPGAFDRLRGERVWVAWADEGGRKVPKSPRGGNAKTNDPSTWGTYAEAAAAASRNGYAGVGLMLTDGYIGIDLDGAVEDGAIADWAQEIIDHFGSYAELSPSGTGIHVVAWADPEFVGPVGRADHSAGIEVYNHGRYFTVTGEGVNSAPIVDATQDVVPFIERYFRGESPEKAVRRRVGNLARDQVKRMANRTMAENCARDGVRYARVPVGSETCGFCIMLASRGFVYHSERSAGELNHYHQNCDCKVIPGFPGMEVEGYDPDSMYELYAEARSRAAHPTDAEISREIERILAERSDVGGGFSSGIDRGWFDQFDPEQMWLRSSNGKVLHKTGDQLSVPITHDEMRAYRGGSALHTHTTSIGGTFSVDDVETTVAMALVEHRLSDTAHSRRFALRRTAATTDELSEAFSSDYGTFVDSSFEDALYEAWRRNSEPLGIPATSEDYIEAEAAIRPMMDEWLADNAVKYGYEYVSEDGVWEVMS